MTRNIAMEITAEARRELNKIYGTRLRGIRLYGSWARGEGREDSDVDIAVILDSITSRQAEHQRLSELQASLSLKHGTIVMLLPVGEADIQDGRYALARSISREGVLL